MARRFNSRAWIATSALVLAGGTGLLAAAAWSGAPLAAQADAWTVDPVHSFVVFRIGHQSVGHAYGLILGTTGSFNIDPKNPAASTLEVSVPAENVMTGNKGRDDHIRRPDFFNVAEYPTITFKATAFKPTGDNTFDVTGDFTFLGQTHPVTAALTYNGTAQGMRGGEVAGLEAKFSIKRSDFGNKMMIGPLSDEVELTVALEGGKK